MPCRANRCHRAAAVLLQPAQQPFREQAAHVWIHDDLLAQAWSSFSRSRGVSLTSKRHGSNVPGPLEARRRLARRRMVGLAQHAGAPMPDFGSLFGTGQADTGSLWKPPRSGDTADLLPLFWQPQPQSPRPPTTHTRQAQRTQAARAPRKPSQPRKDYISELARCVTLDDVVRLHATTYPHGDIPLTFSRAAFQRLLENADALGKQAGSLHDAHLEDIVRFLQHELNHDLAGNVEAYYRWFGGKNISATAFIRYAELLRDKIDLASIPQPEMQSIVATMSSTSRAHPLCDQLRTQAYSILAPAILKRLASYAKTSQRHNDCAALLQGLADLPPSEVAAGLIVQTHSSLSPSNQGQTVPLVAQCLVQWLLHLNRHDAFSVEPTTGPSTPITQVLALLNPRRVENIVINVTARLMTDDMIDHGHRRTIFPYWLYLLRHSAVLQDKPWDSDVWSNVYSHLSADLSPVDIDTHLLALGAVDSARVILHHWVRPRILEGLELPRLKAMSSSSPRMEDTAISYTVSHSKRRTFPDTTSRVGPETPSDAIPSSPTELFKSIENAFEARLAAYSPDTIPEIAPFTDLVAVLQQHSQNYEHILDEIMKLLVRTRSTTRVFTMTMKLLRESVYLPSATVLPLIRTFIETGHPGYALRIFQACDNVWLSLCPDLIFALIENAPMHSMSLFELLNRPEFSNSLPTALRPAVTLNMSEQRVQLVQHMAYALATSRHLTPNQSFRRVCDCLRYLQDRKAPLSSLMSRALVQSGIIRPLQEGRWVSTVKFMWILDYVKKYEGSHVAGLLDRIAFEWRSDNADKECLIDRVSHIYKQKEAIASEYRRSLTHDSHRWKRRTGQWKPWLADRGFAPALELNREASPLRTLTRESEGAALRTYAPMQCVAAVADGSG